MKDVTPLWKASRRTCKIKNEYVLSALGEFWGTFVLALFAVGAGCQATAFVTYFCVGDPNCVAAIGVLPVPLTLIGEIFGLLIGITIFGGASGAHLNPAVTLGLAVSGKIGWTKVPMYWFMQFVGAYLGSGLAYGLYEDKIGESKNIAMFTSAPRSNIGVAFADQVVGTVILVMIVHAALDERNMRIPKFFYGPIVALTFAGINSAFLINAGGLLNPARDLSGRLMAITIGVKEVFNYSPPGSNEPYWLAPFFGPLVGGIIGALLYILFVGAHLEADAGAGQNEDSEDDKHYQGQPGQGQNGQRPDWRSTEFVPRFGAPGHAPPPNKYGSPPPAPAAPAQKDNKKKKGGFGFGDLSKLKDVADGGLDAAQNFENFDPSNMGLEDLQNIKDAAETANGARELAKQGYDAYKHNYGGQPQQQQMNRRSGGNVGYGGSPPPPPPNRYGPPSGPPGGPSRQDYGRQSGNYYY